MYQLKVCCWSKDELPCCQRKLWAQIFEKSVLDYDHEKEGKEQRLTRMVVPQAVFQQTTNCVPSGLHVEPCTLKSKGLTDFAFLKERGMGNIYIIFFGESRRVDCMLYCVWHMIYHSLSIWGPSTSYRWCGSSPLLSCRVTMTVSECPLSTFPNASRGGFFCVVVVNRPDSENVLNP